MASLKSTKNNASRNGPIYEQEAQDSNWLEVTSATLSTQPTALNVNSTGTEVDLTTSGTAYASYAVGVANAFDGDTGTGYISDNAIEPPYYIGYTPAASSVIVKWTWTNNSAQATRYPTSMTLQGSTDTTTGLDGTWTDLDTQSTLTFTSSEKKVFTFANSTSYDSYRVQINTENDLYTSVSDIEFIEVQGITTSTSLVSSDTLTQGQEVTLVKSDNTYVDRELLTVNESVVGNDKFETVIYDGTDAAQTINLTNITTGVDFVWAKSKTEIRSHMIFDSLRGSVSMHTDTLAGQVNGEGEITYNADGFNITITEKTFNNTGTANNVAWCASLPNTASGTTNNAKAYSEKYNSFMSIVKYTGDGSASGHRIPHSLGQIPNLKIIKPLVSGGWMVQYSGFSDISKLRLDTSDPVNTVGDSFGPMTDTYFEPNANTWSGVNGADIEYISYSFASVPGVCAVGSYTGTGVANLNITGLGFDPSWLMVKRTDSTGGNWLMVDTKRPATDAGYLLLADTDAAEISTGQYITLGTDGFTITDTAADRNADGGTYIYLAMSGSSISYTGTFDDMTDTPTKAFTKDDTKLQLAIESTPERIVNELDTNLSVLDTADGATNPSVSPANSIDHTTYIGTNGTVSASNDGTNAAWHAFDNTSVQTNSTDAWLTSVGNPTGWIQYEFNTAKTINKYIMQAHNEAGQTDRCPKNWTIKASNTGAFGGEEDILQTVANETAWTEQEERTYSFINSDTYTHYRVDISAVNGADYTEIGELKFIEATTQTDTDNLVTTEAIYEGEKLFIDDTEVTLGAVTPSGPDTDTVPTMSSNTTTGLAFADKEASATLEAWEVFDDLSRPSETTGWESTDNTGIIGYKYNKTIKVVTSFTIQAEDNTLGANRSPNTWTLQGSNNTTTGLDGTWSTLDTYTAETFTQNQKRNFTTTNTTAYTAYRLNITANNTDTYLGIKELEFIGQNLYSVAHTLTATTPTTAYRKGSKALTASSSVNTEFEVMTYDGNGASQTVPLANITGGVDFALIKGRSGATGMNAFDSIRGATNVLWTHATTQEIPYAQKLNAFGASSFSVGDDVDVNTANANYVAFTASLPTAITFTAATTATTPVGKANSFMSAITYTGTVSGANVEHGLSSAPELILIKNRGNGTVPWAVYSASLPNTSGLRLNETLAEITLVDYWNSTTPTADVFSVGAVNTTGDASNFIAYCFTSVAGKCKVGSYTGTGADNPIDCGFEPAWVMIKRTDNIGYWMLFDNSRGVSVNLKADLSNAEVSEPLVHLSSFDSDGFTIQSSDAQTNASGGTYIYLAIAKEPSTPNTTGKLYGSSDTTGMIAAGDTVLVDNNKPVVASAVLEGTDSVWRANKQFETVTYTGNSSTQTIPMANITDGVDFAWIKPRSAIGQHNIYDSIRGATKYIESSTTDIEETTADTLTAFNANSIELGVDASVGNTNWNGNTFVAWCASLPNHTPLSLHTGATIESETKSNDFMSVVSYTGNLTAGATIGHGLGSVPELIIVKNRSIVSDWSTYSKTIGNGTALALNTTNASYTPDILYWNNTSPTSSVFSVGALASVNGSTNNMIAYAFTSVAGLCKIGSYTGSGAYDGSKKISCGFEPAWIMIKRTDSAVSADWLIFDNQRLTGYVVRANSSSTESTYAEYPMSFNSDGVTVGTAAPAGDGYNALNATYIYLAIADTSKVSLPNYDITLQTAQGSAPTTVAVPNRVHNLPVVTKLYDGTNNKFDYTYGTYKNEGRFLQSKISFDKNGTSTASDLIINMNKVPYVADQTINIDFNTLTFSENF